MNLLSLEKYMTIPIKKNIFKNILSQNISIDERTRIWGLMFGVNELKKEYNYSQILSGILKSIEIDEVKTFYYMLAIQKNTKYKDIFKDELYLVRCFFEVFKNILKIYIPEIYKHQKSNELNIIHL